MVHRAFLSPAYTLHLRVQQMSNVSEHPLPANYGEYTCPSRLNKGLLVYLLTLRSRIGTQPQRAVRRLHCLPGNPYEVVVQCIQVGLVSWISREDLERVSS